jgi:maleylacetate reductase
VNPVEADAIVAGFTVEPLPTRVVFAPGAIASVSDEVDRAGLTRVLVLSTPGHADLAQRLAETLGERVAGVHPYATMHVPVEVAEGARRAARAHGADGCVAIGGGSTIGLAKAIALVGGLPYLAVPTTYAGSEMTPVWGLTEAGEKRTGRHPRVRPRTVIYDPDLTLSLPPLASVTSAVNALAHAVEALYAPDGSPLISLLAREGARALVDCLPALAHTPQDAPARAKALYGAWLCGTCLGATTMSLHHKLCHVLGGAFNLPHAETHAVLLPYTLAYNTSGAGPAVAALREVLGADDPALALWELTRSLGVPHSLRDLGLTEGDVERAVTLATKDPYANPTPVTEKGIRSLLGAALDGGAPIR